MLREFIEGVEKCPFCGNAELTIDSERLFNAVREENGTAAMELRCDNCHTSVWIFYQTDYNKAREELIKKWNRRA